MYASRSLFEPTQLRRESELGACNRSRPARPEDTHLPRQVQSASGSGKLGLTSRAGQGHEPGRSAPRARVDRARRSRSPSPGCCSSPAAAATTAASRRRAGASPQTAQPTQSTPATRRAQPAQRARRRAGTPRRRPRDCARQRRAARRRWRRRSTQTRSSCSCSGTRPVSTTAASRSAVRRLPTPRRQGRQVHRHAEHLARYTRITGAGATSRRRPLVVVDPRGTGKVVTGYLDPATASSKLRASDALR